MKRSPIALVADGISRETEDALEQLLRMAKLKQLKGIAFAAMVVDRHGRRCFTNATGEMYRSPIWARGVVSDLHDALGLLSRGITPEGWEPTS
jgi:hypothetical protein